MIRNFETHKGLDISLVGQAEKRKDVVSPIGDFALVPDDFAGVVPKVVEQDAQHGAVFPLGVVDPGAGCCVQL